MAYATTPDAEATLIGRAPVIVAGGVAAPRAAALGEAREQGGAWLADFSLAPPPAGYGWRLGPVGGPYRAVAAGRVTGFAVAAVSSGLRPDAEAYISGPGGASEPVRLRLTYPPVVLPAIILAGDFSASGGERVGDALVFVLPAAVSPAVVTMAIVAACYDSADATTPVVLLPADGWAEPPATVAGQHVSYVLTVSAPGLPSVILATPRRLIQAAAEPRPPIAVAFTPALPEVQAASSAALNNYKVDATFGSDNEGIAVQNMFAHTVGPMLALEAFSGQMRTHSSTAYTGVKTGAQRLVDHLRRWLNGNRAPAGRSGYNAQYEAQFVATAAITRATPAVWGLSYAAGGLSGDEKVRLDLVMKGCAIGSLWVVSDQNPYGMGVLSGRQRTVRGYKAQRGSVPNYSAPPRLIPFVVDGYMRLNGTTLQAWLTGFDRDAFAAEVAAAGDLTDLWNTYRQTWTLEVMRAAHPGMVEAFGPGPDKAMLHTALRDGFGDGVYRMFGMTLDQAHAMFSGEFERFFSKVVRPGPSTYGASTPLPGREPGPGWATAHGLKTPSPLNGVDETQLRGVLGSVNPNGTTNTAAWAGLPNPGAIGMMAELDDVDGGGGGNPPNRACTTYAYHGASALANLTAAAAVLGLIDRSDPVWAQPDGLAARMRIGVTDFLYRTDHGHREYSKGAQDHPNRDWNLAYIEGQNSQFEAWKGMWRMVDAWLTA